MQIYLAARYSRRLELCGYREQLRAMGHAVEAVWLDGEHQISNEGVPIGEHGEALVEAMSESGRENFYANDNARADALRLKFAEDDLDDVQSCDLCIAFTEPPRSKASRGGRMVELGVAIGQGKRIMIVGPRENIFCWLPEIDQFDTWEACKARLVRITDDQCDAVD